MDGINDHPKDAEKLIQILGSIDCKFNIIQYNEIDDVYKRPSDEKIEAFNAL